MAVRQFAASTARCRVRPATCINGRPLLSSSATASRLNSGANSRLVLLIQTPFPLTRAYQRCPPMRGRISIRLRRAEGHAGGRVAISFVDGSLAMPGDFAASRSEAAMGRGRVARPRGRPFHREPLGAGLRALVDHRHGRIDRGRPVRGRAQPLRCGRIAPCPAPAAIRPGSPFPRIRTGAGP